MARVRGVYLMDAPEGPQSYTSKEAALAASPNQLVADAAFPSNKLASVKNAAFRVNSGGRGEWSNEKFFAIWKYSKDVVLKSKSDESDGSVDVIGFVEGKEVITDDGTSAGLLEDLLKEGSVEQGGWVLLIGARPNIPAGWEGVVSAPGSRKRNKGDGR